MRGHTLIKIEPIKLHSALEISRSFLLLSINGLLLSSQTYHYRNGGGEGDRYDFGYSRVFFPQFSKGDAIVMLKFSVTVS